jgi:hypothetical protein
LRDYKGKGDGLIGLFKRIANEAETLSSETEEIVTKKASNEAFSKKLVIIQ